MNARYNDEYFKSLHTTDQKVFDNSQRALQEEIAVIKNAMEAALTKMLQEAFEREYARRIKQLEEDIVYQAEIYRKLDARQAEEK